MLLQTNGEPRSIQNGCFSILPLLLFLTAP